MACCSILLHTPGCPWYTVTLSTEDGVWPHQTSGWAGGWAGCESACATGSLLPASAACLLRQAASFSKRARFFSASPSPASALRPLACLLSRALR